MTKHLRYVFAALLAVVLVMSQMVAIADSKTFEGMSGSSEVDIVVDYHAATDNSADIEAGANSTRVYSVTLEWQSTGTIEYNAGNINYVWNDGTLKYDGTVENEGWTVDSAKLTVTAKNRSNREVVVTCSTPKAIDGVTITGTYNKSTLNLDSAAPSKITGTGTEKSDQAVYSFGNISGTIGDGTRTIATVTVTITGK